MSWSPKPRVGRRADRRPRERERGAVAVEFALVLPLLVVLLLGTVTTGVAYSRGIGLTNAVREGARFGAIAPNDSNWASAVVARTRQTQFDDPATVTTVCARLLKNGTGSDAIPTTTVRDSGCSTAPSITVTVPSNKCVALVWASRPYQIQTGILPTYNGAMTPKSAALYERTCS